MTDDIEVVVLSDSDSVESSPHLASPTTAPHFRSLLDHNCNSSFHLRPLPASECKLSPLKRRRLSPDLDPAAHRSLDAYSNEPTPGPEVLSKSKTRASPNSKELTAQIKKAAAASRREARERKRAEKKTEFEARRRERVRQKISNHASTGACRRSEVELLVSRQLVQQQRKGMDVLKDVRLLFPTQIVASDERMPNLISWRRKAGIGTHAHVTLAVFSGQQYLDDYRKMHDYARTVLVERRGHKVIFVIWGVVNECKKRMTQKISQKSGGEIIGIRELQDGYTYLYVDFGIRTHVCANEKEAAAYIVHMTDAVASVPYHRAEGFLEASLKYRDLRRTLRHRTTVLAVSSDREQQMENNHEDKQEEDIDANGRRKRSDGESIVESDSTGMSVIRTERSGDLGHVYLAMLCMIPGVSMKKARAIRMQYSTIALLLQAYDECPSQEHRKGMLKDLRYGQNRRRIGPALSTVVAKVLLNTSGFSAIET